MGYDAMQVGRKLQWHQHYKAELLKLNRNQLW
jgi:hypothetical protein